MTTTPSWAAPTAPSSHNDRLFIAEMGDKTQVATVMLAAQYPEFVLVILGTTVGMLLANVPVVLVSHFAADRLPLTLIRRVAAGGFSLSPSTPLIRL